MIRGSWFTVQPCTLHRSTLHPTPFTFHASLTINSEYPMTTEERKDLLLNAAMSVFSQHGYHNAKMTKIAEVAGIGTGSVYLHFKSKEQMLEELFVRAWTRINELVTELYVLPLTLSSDKIHRIIEFILEMAKENPAMASIFLHEHRFWSNGPSTAISVIVQYTKLNLIGIYQQGIDRGEFRPDLQAEMAAEMFIGALWQVLALYSEKPHRLREKNLTNRLHAIAVNGLH